MKEDLITTQPVSGGQWDYIAFIPGKEALAQGGDTEDEAIGRLWLASAGDIIATFLDIATQQNKPTPTDKAYKAMETALQVLTGQILNLRTELLFIKSTIVKDDNISH